MDGLTDGTDMANSESLWLITEPAEPSGESDPVGGIVTIGHSNNI